MYKNKQEPLARWLVWLEPHPMHQKAASLVPSQGTYPGCGFNPQLGRMWETTDQCFSLTLMFLSPSLPLPLSHPSSPPHPFLPLSLSLINKHPWARRIKNKETNKQANKPGRRSDVACVPIVFNRIIAPSNTSH